MGCETANYLYTRCPEVVSTNCVTYQGADIPCLGICKGSNLSVVEMAIANRLCELSDLTDATIITVPACIIAAWNAGQEDKTILNLLQFALDQICVLQAEITVLQTPVEPKVTLDYACCSTNSCVTTGKVTLSVALQNIINCICEVKSEITDLKNTVNTLKSEILVLEDQINNPLNGIGALQTQLVTQQISIATLQSTVACIISQVGTITCP